MTNATNTEEKKARNTRERKYVIEERIDAVKISLIKKMFGGRNVDGPETTYTGQQVIEMMNKKPQRLWMELDVSGGEDMSSTSPISGLAEADKMIKENGENGSVYRIGHMTSPVLIETETEIKRKITPVE